MLKLRPARWLARLAVLGVLALSLGGCEELCSEGAVTWCPPGSGGLNRPPELDSRGIMIESRFPDVGRGTRSAAAVNVGIVNLETRFIVSVSDRDGDPLLVEWDLDGDGEFEQSRTTDALETSSVFKIFRQTGAVRIHLRVSDFPSNLGVPGELTRERLVAIIERDGNRFPTAEFVMSPSPARAGEPVTFDAGASSDPDFYDNPPFNSLFHFWMFGDGSSERSSSPVTHTFATPGVYRVSMAAGDSFGLGTNAAQTLSVLDPGAPNTPPVARFTVMPAAPAVGQQARFDGSSSSDVEGPIARYEWDLDGDGSFERDGGRQPMTDTSYGSPGERLISLRVTDGRGVTATVRRAVNVRRDPLPPARAAQAPRPRAGALAFSARLNGTPEQARGGSVQRRGRRVALLGVVGEGRLLARTLDPPGRPSRAERSARRFLTAPWRTKIGFSLDRRTKGISASGIALARTRRGRPGNVCLRVRLSSRPGKRSTGRLTLLGGTGAGARLRGGARVRFRLEDNGAATVLGRLRASSGKARPLPGGCRRLAG